MAQSRFDLILPDDVRELEVVSPAEIAVDRLLHAVPRIPGELHGRHGALEELMGALRRDDVFLMTITGAGGTGKTRLAVEAARTLVDDFSDGVVFVPLASLRDPELVVSKIAQTFSLKEGAGGMSLELLARELGEKRLLLILDNFEHLLPAAGLVTELLNVAPGLTILVTSRTLLRIAGEREFPLTPLAVPDPETLPPLDALLGYGAVALFVERARASRPDFELTTENARFVVEICRRVDGLPLAIELAAARVALLSPESLLRRLDERLTFLTGGARDRAPHQQGLVETIEWSVSLLKPIDQRLFAEVSVFTGGFTVPAAEDVCAESRAGTVVDGLGVLLENSLLRRGSSHDGELRFAMLATIRDFALDRLEQTGGADTVRSRHAEHFAALVERASPELKMGDHVKWIARLEAEHDNLRAALRWTLATERKLLALRLAGPLWRFWRDQGYLSEGKQWLDAALTAGVDQPPDVRAEAQWGITALLDGLGEIDAARDSAEATLALYRQAGDAAGIARSFDGLGQTACRSGDFERGLPLLKEAVSQFRKIGDERGVAYAKGNLGYYSFASGDLIAATAYLEEALPAFRLVGDVAGEAWVFQNLAFIALTHHRIDDAAALLRESLSLAREWQMQDDVVALGLIGAASIAEQRQELSTVARLLGAEDAWRETAGLHQHQDFESALHERTIVAARPRLGEPKWGRAFAEGRELGVQKALDEALGMLEAGK